MNERIVTDANEEGLANDYYVSMDLPDGSKHLLGPVPQAISLEEVGRVIRNIRQTNKDILAEQGTKAAN